MSAVAILRISSPHPSKASDAIERTGSIVGVCSGARIQERPEMFRAFSHKKQRVFVPVLVWAPLGGPSRRKYEAQPFRNPDHIDIGFVDQRSALCTDYSEGNRSVRLHGRTDSNASRHVRDQSSLARDFNQGQ